MKPNSTINNIKLTNQKHQTHSSKTSNSSIKTSGRGQFDVQEAYGVGGVFEGIGHDGHGDLWQGRVYCHGQSKDSNYASTCLDFSCRTITYIFICLFIICLLYVGAHCTSGPWTQPVAPWSPAENYPRTGILRRRPRYRISCVGVNVYLFFCLLIYFIVYCLLRSCMPQAVWVWAHSGCQWHISESGPTGRTQATTRPGPQCASWSLISHIVTVCLCSL